MTGQWVVTGHVRLRAGVVVGGDYDFDYNCGSYVRDGSEGSVVQMRRPTFVLDQGKNWRGKGLRRW